MIQCGETQRHVLGKFAHRPNHQASAYKDTWRTDQEMTENQHLVWVLSMPLCASINDTMQKFSGVSYETSDRHNDV